MENNKIEKRIARLERNVLRYKNNLAENLKSDNFKDIEGALNAYSNDIIALIKTIEELKELI